MQIEEALTELAIEGRFLVEPARDPACRQKCSTASASGRDSATRVLMPEITVPVGASDALPGSSPPA